MSKIGKKPIQIPEGVTVNEADKRLVVSGPKGELSLTIPMGFRMSTKDESIILNPADLADSATFGRIRSQIANAVQGASEKWTKTLEVVGTGYRVATDGKTLTLNLGFSHPVALSAPEGIEFQVAQNKITILGVDKQVVGEVAAKIKNLRPVEPYKGKGIKYENEIVRKKQGKAAKGVGGVA